MNKSKAIVAAGVVITGGIIATVILLMREGPPPGEPALELIQAQWDKDVYAPGENAILTARFKNPTATSWEYTTYMRYTDVYTGEPVRFEQAFTLAPGQQMDVSYACTALDSTRIVYIETYCSGESLGTFRAPDLVISAPTPEAYFIMLGAVNNEETWQGDVDTGHYTKQGIVKNVGGAEGNQEVVGWWKVGNSGQPHEAHKEVVTLKPGETKPISYTISAEAMLEAQREAGFEKPTLNFLVAYISTPDQARYLTDQGYSYTSDIVHIPEEM
jgi:hypothetical protein